MDIKFDGTWKGGIANPANLPKGTFEVVYIGGFDRPTEDITNESLAMLSLITSLEKLNLGGDRFTGGVYGPGPMPRSLAHSSSSRWASSSSIGPRSRQCARTTSWPPRSP